jgi:hypothetical protein
MSEDTPKVHKPDPQPEASMSAQTTDVAPPVELTAMVIPAQSKLISGWESAEWIGSRSYKRTNGSKQSSQITQKEYSINVFDLLDK